MEFQQQETSGLGGRRGEEGEGEELDFASSKHFFEVRQAARQTLQG